MLLKKITLENFRPFKGNHEIEFSVDKEKNVTLVIAENGAGKTTLAQAFQWVLYSKIEAFTNKSVLNSIVQSEMRIGSEVKVEVKLELSHNNMDYTVIRKQIYRKDASGNVKQDASELEVYTKGENGQTITNSPSRNTTTISNILPPTLAKYFFFDGERIDKMASEVASGKSEEFKTAVQNILGLTALTQAIEHLNPGRKESVIGRYLAQKDKAGGQETVALRDKIYELGKYIENNKKEMSQIEEDLLYYKNEIEKAKVEIASFVEAEKLQKELIELNRNLEMEKKAKVNAISVLMDNFAKQTHEFMAKKLIKDALEELQKTEHLDKGIPAIREETIRYLMERKKCLCGADLTDATSHAAQCLIELLKYIPPQSLGTAITSFQKDAGIVTKHSENYFQNMEKQFSAISGYRVKIEKIEHEIGERDQALIKSATSKVGELKQRQIDMEKNLRLAEDRLNTKKAANMRYEDEIKDANISIEKRQLQVERNKHLDEQINYARVVYNIFKQNYASEEEKTRKKLEDQMNMLFKKIYSGGMTIELNEKYRIKSHVNDLKEVTSNLDANTAKAYSIIFAFIVAIIDLAKKKVKEKNEVYNVVTDEYPLVMDAPLSSFDQTRIKNICEVIPSIARQVVIFIKDTDGNIAKEQLSSKVGIQYLLESKDKEKQVESKITKVGEY